MKKRLFLYVAAGFLFVSVLGTLSHFFYEWSGKNLIVGLFTPINESTWEHMKLLFFPMLISSGFLIYKLHKDYPHITSALCIGILVGTFLIPILFYTYSGILGFNTTVIDIAIFYLCVLAAFFLVYRYAASHVADKYKIILIAAVCLLFFCFITFTFFPPAIGLFHSPV